MEFIWFIYKSFKKVASINNNQPAARTQKLLEVINGIEVNCERIAKAPASKAISHVTLFGGFNFMIPPFDSVCAN
jgi:hypothetical protein